MNLQDQIKALVDLTANLSKATSIREKVKLADRIFETLGECERTVDHFIVSELSVTNGNGNGSGSKRERQAPKDTNQQETKTPPAGERPVYVWEESKKFLKLTLAAIGYSLLTEHGLLHGSEIEKAAKAGGFKSSAVAFQSYLATAFNRDGRFINTGKNFWRLKTAEETADEEAAKN